MNTKNNRRRQASREKLQQVFIELLQTRELSQISVAELCKLAQLNRSTFYANYTDVYDLADQIRDRLEAEVNALYGNDPYPACAFNYLRLFRHIRDNQLFYSTYFKLGYDTTHVINLDALDRVQHIFPEAHMAYHIEFHKAGLNAIIKAWLRSGCRETPETMTEIISSEYRGRQIPETL